MSVRAILARQRGLSPLEAGGWLSLRSFLALVCMASLLGCSDLPTASLLLEGHGLEPGLVCFPFAIHHPTGQPAPVHFQTQA